MEVTDSQARDLIKLSPNKAVSSLANETAVVKSVAKVITCTLKMTSDPPLLAIANKTLAISGVAQKTGVGTDTLRNVNFMTSQTLKTIGLVKVAGMTPGKGVAYVSLTLAEKIVSAAGMAEFDKCKMAISSLAITTGMGALGCAGTAGIGCFAGAIAVAADAFDVYGQCQAPPVR